MAFTYFSRQLRQILPRVELRERDRRPGAYPVKSKTGDRTRSGRNNVYFDDGRTVLFMTGVNVTYPTTRQFDSRWVGEDLTGSLGTVIGNVNPYAVEQFIIPARQTERVGSFFDTGLFEQNETNVVNSKFMTGVANAIAPDRFKSKISNKTIVRMELPLSSSSLNASTSSMCYYDNRTNRFETIVLERTLNFTQGGFPRSIAPIAFTPYGYHFIPRVDQTSVAGGGISADSSEIAYKAATVTFGDGSDVQAGAAFVPSSSLLNPVHAAHASQSIKMSSYISHPFLLEKVVVEFPFQAGAGWLNDRFGIREIMVSDLSYAVDVGGPMITFALMRQDGSDTRNRDLITSGTITNRLDMTTGSYQTCTASYGGGGGYNDVMFTPEGLGAWNMNAAVVISGSSLSGSTNAYTGSIAMTLDPQVTTHLWRTRSSGSCVFFWGGVGTTGGVPPTGVSANSARPTMSDALYYGPINRRSSKYLQSSRNILGNQFVLLESARLNGQSNPVYSSDSQFENLEQDLVAPRFFKLKLFFDVISKTQKCPYLLFPEDSLVFCLNKHRAVGSPNSADWNMTTTPTPNRLVATHDVQIPAGALKITLYGDLLKEDVEFHDTLNQRLETAELWQDVGEDPVLDQFDVVYRGELSGTYLDRFSPLKAFNSILTDFSSSIFTDVYYSNFSDTTQQNTSWSEQFDWSKTKKIYEAQKSSRNVMHTDSNAVFWDSRIPNPKQCMTICNPSFKLGIHGSGLFMWTGSDILTLTGTDSGLGIFDWGMTYPYEARFSSVTQQFSNTLTNDVFTKTNGVIDRVSYDSIGVEVGQTILNGFTERVHGSEIVSNTVPGLRRSEFLKIFFGIGDGNSSVDNQYTKFRSFRSAAGDVFGSGVEIRGWRYGMMSGFPLRPTVVYRRDRFGQPRDLLEQRLDAKFFDELGLSLDGTTNGVVGVKTGPVQVYFYDNTGKQTDPLKTLSSNVSFEATSSIPYFDGSFRNRSAYDFNTLNIKNVII